jgi:hypothetical protein
LIARLKITGWECSKLREKGCGFLRFQVESEAISFIRAYDNKFKWHSTHRLYVRFERDNRTEQNELQEAAWFQQAKSHSLAKQVPAMDYYPGDLVPTLSSTLASSVFGVSFLHCGHYEYNGSRAEFLPIAPLGSGRIVLGTSHTAILIDSISWPGNWEYRIDLDHHLINMVVASPKDSSVPCLLISLRNAPRVYRRENDPNELVNTLNRLFLGQRPIQASYMKRSRSRISHINQKHSTVVGTCFVYRLGLADHQELNRLHDQLKLAKDFTSPIKVDVRTSFSGNNIVISMQDLNQELANYVKNQYLDFKGAFQLLKLAYNGKLLPWIVIKLIPSTIKQFRVHGAEKLVLGLISFYESISEPGPATQAHEFDINFLEQQIEEHIHYAVLQGSMFHTVKRAKHLLLIHRIRITPTGIYLEGPSPEPGNRVIRKYRDHVDCFARLTFSDEDGERLEQKFDVSVQTVYNNYLDVLRAGINLFGKNFSFLGFSSSSLRSQTCWVMSDITLPTGMLLTPASVIEGLGNFRDIQIPAKCAARIGQAFTETSAAITIDPDTAALIGDVERNGRVFSDGCGTISEELLYEIRKQYPRVHMKTDFAIVQMRMGGAKGVLSLDPKLPGKMVCTRPSMVKYQARGDLYIEVCGIADRKIPLYLNRPLIKVLEDLGVPYESFLRLQNDMVEELEEMMSSDAKAAAILSRENIAGSSGMADLIHSLNWLGLSGQDDRFLRNIVEFGALHILKDVKYRGRIRVNNGLKLYGCMDETGWLKEGQIYCSWIENNHQQFLQGERVVVTRSPTMHPGDVQVVRSVLPPPDSPLRQLQNCVVFSQFGQRDLPSMLGGGDLDGDQFDVIWEHGFIPTAEFVQKPADYPRTKPVDIGRAVVLEDIMGFFIGFMDSDRVAQISSIHLQLADRLKDGTKSEGCIKLAEMASHAVDYPKTGLPVNMHQRPKFDATWKPDFMAPNPKIKVAKITDLWADLKFEDAEQLQDPFGALTQSDRKIRYYESQKVLGKLFRSIDERGFYLNIKRHWTSDEGSPLLHTALNKVYQYSAGFEYEHHMEEAKKIREVYENVVSGARYTYAFRQDQPLHELEVLTGYILGTNTKFNRENSRQMRESLESSLAYVRELIAKGTSLEHHRDGSEDKDYEDDEAYEDARFPRSIACFTLAMNDEEHQAKDNDKDKILSWKYFAASVCLKELETVFRLGKAGQEK